MPACEHWPLIGSSNVKPMSTGIVPDAKRGVPYGVSRRVAVARSSGASDVGSA
jgi:hypothetical protein